MAGNAAPLVSSGSKHGSCVGQRGQIMKVHESGVSAYTLCGRKGAFRVKPALSGSANGPANCRRCIQLKSRFYGDLKICSVCNKAQPPEAFKKDPRCRSGRANPCMECMRRASNEYNRKHLPQRKELIKEAEENTEGKSLGSVAGRCKTWQYHQAIGMFSV